MTLDLDLSAAELRIRERTELIARHVTAATGRATEAIADADPLRSLALLDLATDELIAAVEHARVRVAMVLRGRPGARP